MAEFRLTIPASGRGKPAKTFELTLDERECLLKPYGWGTITTIYPADGWLADAIEIRLDLCPSSHAAAKQNEWLVRQDLLMQAMGAVEAVRAAGYWLEDAPEILIGGKYMFTVQGGSAGQYVLDNGAGRVRMIVRKTK